MVVGCVLAVLPLVGTVQSANSSNGQAELTEIVLFDNTYLPPVATLSHSSGWERTILAQPFFTGDAIDLTSVTFSVRRQGFPGGRFDVEIWDDNGAGWPGERIATLGSVEINSLSSNWSLVTVHGLVTGLAPHTPYFVALPTPEVDFTSATVNFRTLRSEGTHASTEPPRRLVGNRRNAGDSWIIVTEVLNNPVYNYLLMKITAAGLRASHTPRPANGAMDVHREGILSWAPGVRVAPVDGHVIYFSENFDHVKDGVGGVTLSAESFDPGRLEFNKTYYWRVDEVAAPPESTVFKGNVWSFTTEPFSYPIANITATASGALGASVPENTVNGSGLVDDLDGTSAADMWISGGIPAWIQYEFDRAYKLHEMWIWNSNQLIESFVGFGAKDVVIEHSLDGTDWRALDGVPELAQAPGTEGYAANNVIDFGGAMAQFVRIQINSVQGLSSRASLSEVRFFYEPVFARNPEPENGAVEDTLDAVLTWRPGREAGSHQVFLSESMDAVLDESALIASTLDASLDLSGQDLKYSATYYWKVNEVNDLESPPIHGGELWQFMAPEYIAVDDMERYRDQEGLEIWMHWVDGVGDDNNGSIVGNENDAEKEQVVERRQSLPMLYDNGPATVSAATRTFDPPLDWVRGAPEVLPLFFLADPTRIPARNELVNDPAPLYVVITDSSGQTVQVDYPDPAATHITSWTEWIIPISELGGIDLSSVQSMTVGIGGDGKTATGKMFFDNIRVGTPMDQAP